MRLSADRRRAQLLEVAGTLFAEQGFHGSSMEQLAEAAGVSKPVLYQHFPSKRALYLALVREAVAVLDERVAAALEGTTDNRARVHGAIRAYVDFVEDRRFALLFTTAEVTDDDVRAEIERGRALVAERVADLIAHDAGLSGPAARLLASAVRGLAMDGARWWLEQPADERPDKDEAVRLLSRLAWRGLGSFEPGVERAVPALRSRPA